MITNAYICPHTPLLIPGIGKENINLLQTTKESVEYIAAQIAQDKPDIILTLTSHGPNLKNALVLNVDLEYKINFEAFGDFSESKVVESDLDLIGAIQSDFEDLQTIKSTTIPILDHGSGVPLNYIINKYANFKLVPLYTSQLSLLGHYEIGQVLKKQINKTNKKVTIIASGELSHRLSKNSPSGYLPQAKKFDQKIIQALQNKDIGKLLNIKEETIKNVHECGLKPIATLLGIFHNYNYAPQEISYEKPLGVGHLAFEFKV